LNKPSPYGPRYR